MTAGGGDAAATADARALQAVSAAAQAGDLSRAIGLAQAALARGIEHPLLFNLAALDHERRGEMERAVALLERAVRLAPEDAASHNALGLCLMQLERAEAALAQFDALIALNPALPYAYASRGNALLAVGDMSQAENAYRQALERDPGQGVALAGLARIASHRGAYPAARERAERALSVLPGYPDAVMSLARAEWGEKRVARAHALLRDLLADGRLSVLERAHALGLLGDVLDAENRCDEAFAAYTECNTRLHQYYAAGFAGEVSAFGYVESMSAYFAGAPPPLWQKSVALAGTGYGARGHVFVLGFPRSGTTLIEVVLEGHPDVVSLEEKESLIDAVRAFMRAPADLERLARSSDAALEPLRAAYWRRVAEAGVAVAGRVFVDKHPLNSLKLPLIARLFPDAKIVFACRDPRDVVLSCFRHRFRMSAPFYELLTLGGAARYYAAVMELATRLTALLPLDVCLLRHEDVVTEFVREMKRLCVFLGLEWVPAMGDFALRTRERGMLTPSTAQLVRGLNTEGLGQWRRYREHMTPVLEGLEPWVRRFYYEAD